MNAEQKFCAVTRDNAGVALWYWLGTEETCGRRAQSKCRDDERVSSYSINEVDPSMTWDQMRGILWPSDPTAKRHVIWSGTWADIE